MQYGAMNFPVKPVLNELEIIAGLGFDYLELTMDPPLAHYQTIREIKTDLKAALERLGMGLVCHLPTFVGLADLTPGIRKASVMEMSASLETAAELNASKVVIHPGYVTGLGAFVSDKARKYGFESMTVVIEKALSLGITLCIENMFPRANSLVEPTDFSELLSTFPELRLTLDIGHAAIGARGEKRNLEFIEKYSDRILHIHASDNFGKEDNHLPIGAGMIDFPKVMKALRKIGYDKTMTLEVFSRDKDYLKISRDKLSAMISA